MKIILDGKEYEIDPNQFNAWRDAVQEDVLAEYNKAENWVKVALKPIARFMLMKFEPHWGEQARPKKHENPNLLLIHLLLDYCKFYVAQMTLEVSSDGGSNITAIKTPTYQGLPRGQMGNPGSDGAGQDVLCQGADAPFAQVS